MVKGLNDILVLLNESILNNESIEGSRYLNFIFDVILENKWDELLVHSYLLSKIVEIGDISINDLLLSGYNLSALEVVSTLYRNEGENYDEYIQRVILSGNMYALILLRSELKRKLINTDLMSDKSLEYILVVDEKIKLLYNRR